MGNASIVGIGSTAFGRQEDRDIVSLAVEAAEAAILESGIDRARIGAVYLGNFIAGPLTGQEVLAGLVADNLGLENVPCTKVEGACASGGIAFRHGVLSVRGGGCDAVLVVGVEKMSGAPTEATTAALNCAMDNRSDGVTGLTFPGLFGMAWRVYEGRYGLGRDQVSAVVRKNKANGLNNPLAQMGRDLSDDEIAQSPLICDPMRLFDCCPTSDGAAALVIAGDGVAGEVAAPPVRVMASAQTRGAARIAGHGDLCSFDATVSAARRACAEAGIAPGDVDVVELHDCFSVAEIIDAEDIGLMPRGHGAGWAAEGRTAVGGDCPINPSGGLLAKGHPVGATGIGQLYETTLQLRGTHPNQVRDAAIGLTHNLGGTGVACTVNILGRADA
jgi:acetyl-CoA C-acetyltransferase